MKLRILHTNMHRGGWGGQPNRILLLCKGLKERGHHVIIAAPKGATLIERAKEEGIPTYDDLEFPKKFKPHVILSEIIKLKRLIEKEDIQIVHTHGSQDTWAATIAAKFARNRPLVIRTRHNTFPVANHFGNRILYRMLIDHVVVVSQGIIETYKKTGVMGNKVNQITTIYSVINPERFANVNELKERIREEFSIGNRFVFTKVARLAVEKGHIFFLKAANSINQKLSALFFALGDGPLRGELEEKRREMGIEVIFTGIRKDVPGFLANTDVFLFTPISGESLGTSLLESLYCRVPVVSFRIEGVNASIEDGKTGFLVSPKDHHSLSEIAVKIATSRKIRKRLGANGYKKVSRQFVLRTLVEETERLYRRIISQKGGGSAPPRNN